MVTDGSLYVPCLDDTISILDKINYLILRRIGGTLIYFFQFSLCIFSTDIYLIVETQTNFWWKTLQIPLPFTSWLTLTSGRHWQYVRELEKREIEILNASHFFEVDTDLFHLQSNVLFIDVPWDHEKNSVGKPKMIRLTTGRANATS